MQRNKQQCQKCLCYVSLSNLVRHQASKACQNGGVGKTKAEKYPWEEWRIGADLYKMSCGYMGSKVACRNKLINQQVVSETGPGGNFGQYHESLKNGGATTHNKGKPLPLAQRKKISAANKAYAAQNGATLFTEEQRKIMSEKRKAYLAENPGEHPNAKVAGNRGKMTYPEKVAFDWFKERGIEAEHNTKVDRFYPDFLVGSIVVEIDGERWHGSEDQKQKDSLRDDILSDLGYTVHRIPSKDNIHARLEKIFAVSK